MRGTRRAASVAVLLRVELLLPVLVLPSLAISACGAKRILGFGDDATLLAAPGRLWVANDGSLTPLRPRGG